MDDVSAALDRPATSPERPGSTVALPSAGPAWETGAGVEPPHCMMQAAGAGSANAIPGGSAAASPYHHRLMTTFRSVKNSIASLPCPWSAPKNDCFIPPNGK